MIVLEVRCGVSKGKTRCGKLMGFVDSELQILEYDLTPTPYSNGIVTLCPVHRSHLENFQAGSPMRKGNSHYRRLLLEAAEEARADGRGLPKTYFLVL